MKKKKALPTFARTLLEGYKGYFQFIEFEQRSLKAIEKEMRLIGNARRLVGERSHVLFKDHQFYSDIPRYGNCLMAINTLVIPSSIGKNYINQTLEIITFIESLFSHITKNVKWKKACEEIKTLSFETHKKVSQIEWEKLTKKLQCNEVNRLFRATFSEVIQQIFLNISQKKFLYLEESLVTNSVSNHQNFTIIDKANEYGCEINIQSHDAIVNSNAGVPFIFCLDDKETISLFE